MNSLLQMVEASFHTRAKSFVRAMGRLIRPLAQGGVRPAFAFFASSAVYSQGAVAVAALLGFGAVEVGAVVDIAQFAPNPALAEYSVYATDTVWMPVNSGTANGGYFGSANYMFSDNGLRLRCPYVTVRGNFELRGIQQNDTTATGGSNTRSRVNVDGTLTSKGYSTFLDAVEVGRLSVEGDGLKVTDTIIADVIDIGSGYGNTYFETPLVWVDTTFTSQTTLKFSAGQTTVVKMGGAAGYSVTSFPLPQPPMYSQGSLIPELMGPALKKNLSDLPGQTVVGYSPPSAASLQNISVPASASDDVDTVLKRPVLGMGDTLVHSANCSNYVGSQYCNGNVLKPGYYGDLTIDRGVSTLLLGEGFYSFKSIKLSNGADIIALQPKGGRTFVYSEGDISISSNAFVGPENAYGATGYGTGSGQFLGGTLMLIGARNIKMDSDMKIWATISAPGAAPYGYVEFNSNDKLYGQVFARKISAKNNIDFGVGAYIKFDPELPVIEINRGNNFSIREDSTTVGGTTRYYKDTTISVSISKANAYDVTVDWKLVDGDGVPGTQDAVFNSSWGYTTPSGVSGGTLMIAKGSTSASFTIRIPDDRLFYDNRLFRIILENPRNAKFSGKDSTTDTTVVTIEEDDPKGTFSFVKLKDPVAESVGKVAVGVRLSVARAVAATIDVVPVPLRGNATIGKDYTFPAKVTLKFSAGDTLVTFDSLRIIDDRNFEANESLFLALSNPSAGGVDAGKDTSVIKILDDDPMPAIAFDAPTRIAFNPVTEPDLGATVTMKVLVTLVDTSGVPLTASQLPEVPLTYGWHTTDYTATISGGDYVKPIDTIRVFPSGKLTDTLRVVVNGDNHYEGTERIAFYSDTARFVNLNRAKSTPTPLGPGLPTFFGIIFDNDLPPALKLTTAAVTEPDAPATVNQRYIVTLVNPTTGAAYPDTSWLPTGNVLYTRSFRDSTAMVGTDYDTLGLTGSDTIFAGSFADTFNVKVLGDDRYEGTEAYVATIVPGLNANASSTRNILTAAGVILDDETAPYVCVADTSTTEMDANTAASVRVFLSNSSTCASILDAATQAPELAVRFNWGTNHGTAWPNTDYVSVTQAATVDSVARSTVSKNLSVTIVGDDVYEPTENFTVGLASFVNGLSGRPTGTVTIADDDVPPTVASIASLDFLEGNSSSRWWRFKVKMSSRSEVPMVFTWSTENLVRTDGTAAASGEDYVAVPSTPVTIPVGSDSAFLDVEVKGDLKYEKDEVFGIRVSPVSGITAPGSVTAATGTIRNDDTPPTIASIADVALAEGNSGTKTFAFKLKLSAPSGLVSVITWGTVAGAVSPDSAKAGEDFAAVAQTATIPAGSDSAILNVTVNGDTKYEKDEFFHVVAVSGAGLTVSRDTALGTILNDDAQPSVRILDAADVTEPAAYGARVNATFRIVLSAKSGLPVAVTWATLDSSASHFANDYKDTGSIVTFRADLDSLLSVTVPVLGDSLDEPTEAFWAIISNATNALRSAATDSARAHILDNDTAPAIHIDPLTVNEPASATGTTPAVVNVWLDRVSGLPVTFRWSTRDGSATSGTKDYDSTGETSRTIPAGTQSITLPAIVVRGDSVANEGTEKFRVALAGVSNASGTDTTDTVSIVDQTPLPVLSIASSDTVDEADVDVPFVISLDYPSAVDVRVLVKTVPVTATSGADYRKDSLWIPIPALSKTWTIYKSRVYEDNRYETTIETYEVRLDSAVAAQDPNGLVKAVVGIRDDEPVPSLSIDDATVSEPDVPGATTTARYTVTLSGPSELPVSVDWATDTSRTAAHGASSVLDYVGKGGVLAFPADSVTKTIDVQVLGDSLDEYDEGYLVRLSKPVVATLAKDTGVGLITDTDSMPALSIENDTIGEGGTLWFVARLERPSAKDVSFAWTTRDGSAIAGLDYAAAGTTATIPAFSTTTSLPVATTADAVASEGDEDMFVKLTALANAGVGDTLGQGVIQDLTNKPGISIDSVGSFKEPRGDSQVVFHVKLSNPSATAVTVDFKTVSGKATVGKDVADTTGTIAFAAGETSKDLPIRVIADAFHEEPSEDFAVELTGAGGGAAISQPTGLGVILDEDPAPSISILDTAIREPAVAGAVDSALLVVRLSAPSNLPTTVAIALSDSTAVSPADYAKSSGTLVFAPGVTEIVFKAAVFGDSLYENDEWFLAALSAPVNGVLADSAARVRIADNDTAPTLSVGDASVREGDIALVTVSLTRPSAKDVVFDWRTIDVTAQGGFDYEAFATTTDTIKAYQTSVVLRVPAYADTVANEFDETFRVLVTRATDALLPDSDGVVTILDQTARPQIRILGAGNVEEDPVFLTFPIVLDRASAVPVRVRWHTLEGTAKASLDFQDTTGILTIPAGSVRDSVKVRVLEDALYEPWDESLQVVLSQPESAAIAIDRATGYISDDKDNPPVTIDSATPVTEGGTAYVPVRLLNESADTVFVWWHTVDGTAKSPDDYVAASGMLVFRPRETALNVSVVTVVDSIWEPTEMFHVRIDSVDGGFISDSSEAGRSGKVSLLEEGAYPTISFDMRDTSVVESKAGDVPVVVKLSRAASVPLKMGVVVDGASVAVRDLDYALRNLSIDTLLIPALSTSASFVARVIDDSLDETDELVRLGFVKVGGPAAVGRTSWDLTIIDDDSAPSIRFDVDSQKVPESVGKVTVRADLARPSAKDIDVWFSVGGTATAGGVDHDLKPFHLHFDAGATSATVVFDVVDDAIDEPDETVTVTLDSAKNGNLTTPTRQIVVILDNDEPPRSRFVDTVKTVKENVGTVNFPISLDHPSSRDVVVRISVRGSAILDSLRKGSDAVLDSDVVYQVTIPAGDTTATFKIAVINDGRVESTEDVELSMVGGDGADDKFASASRLVILDDDRNPDVVITRPADSLRTKDSLQTIHWTWDGVPQPIKDTVLKEGWNRISRCATDTAGNTGCDTVHVWADFTPPRVEITRPDSVFLTNKTGVQVCWTVTDSGATWKRVADPCMDTTLKEGTHTIVRTACDSVGNCGSDQVIVTVDLTPPTGMFLYPPDSAYIRVKEQPARIRWIDDGDTILVRDTLVMSHYGWNTFTATYKDKAGNEGRTSVTVYYQAPQVEDGWYEDSNGDGKVDEVVVEFDSPWESDSLPTFTFELGGETRTVKVEKAEWYEEGTRGVPAVDTKGKVVVDSKGDTVYLAPGIAMTDKDGRPVIDGETGKPVTSPVGEVYRDASGKPVYDKDGLEMYRVPGPGSADRTRLVVHLPNPFKYGVTSVSSGDSGTMKVTLPVVDASGKTVDSKFQKTFPLADSVAPIISKAVVVRTESYTGKDSVFITPSEPIDFDSSGTWVEVKVDGKWHVVPAESLAVLEDGRIVILVEPGEDGSVRPGLEVRFGNGVSDTSGNAKAPSETEWATKVEGGPRPPLLEMVLPQAVKTVPSEEVNKERKGGFVIRATNKGSDDGYQWWKPGTGYTNSSDPAIREICPDLRYCNGVEVYVNRPVRLFLFVYDLSGTFVIRDEINITQSDIDGLKADKLDRVRIQLQWNMRGKDNRVVGTGIYLWRIVSYVMDPNYKTPIMSNQIVRIGVKSPLR